MSQALSDGLDEYRGADRLAQGALVALLIAVAFGVLLGLVVAIFWRPGSDFLGFFPYAAVGGAYFVVLAMSLPSLFSGLGDLFRGDWRAGLLRLLTFFGPLLVVVGAEAGSHLLIPCDSDLGWGNPGLVPWLCETYVADDGSVVTGIADRWHLLHHTLVAGLPLAILYWLAIRTWRPALAPLPRFGGAGATTRSGDRRSEH